jgi:DNA invertase Pin-like site-specific DNA recombinase
MAKIGYARVSTPEQNINIQFERLKDCDKIFQDKKSGKSDQRSGLQSCLEYVREGDILIVTKLDRLARSTLHLCQIVDELHRKNVDFKVLDQDIDTSTSSGRLLFNVLSSIAQFETELRAERQMDGIRDARSRGIHFGRKKVLTEEQLEGFRERRKQGVLVSALAKEAGISRGSMYRLLGKDVKTDD